VEASLREAGAHFARQKQIIEELRQAGQPTRIVESLLRSLESVLSGHRQYAKMLRRVSRSRTSGEALHAEWSSAMADAQAQLGRLDKLLVELSHNIASSRQAIEESRTLTGDAMDSNPGGHDGVGR
jgi:hypothetical protein